LFRIGKYAYQIMSASAAIGSLCVENMTNVMQIFNTNSKLAGSYLVCPHDIK